MTDYEGLSLVVSVVAAGLALASLWQSWRSSRKLIELQREQSDLARLQRGILEREQAATLRADIRLEVVGDRLYVKNIGPAEARNVTLEVIMPEGGSDSVLIESEMRGKLPVTLLSQDQIDMLIAKTFPMPDALHMRVRWTDVIGQPQEQKQTLTL